MTRNKNAYREASGLAQDETDDYTPSPGNCHAWGCPLPGVYAENGGHKWMCACHDGIRGSDWHKVTNRVNNRIGAFEACHRVITAPPILGNWVPRARAFLERHQLAHLVHAGSGGLSFTQSNGEPVTARRFFMNLLQALIAECRADLNFKSDPVSRAAQSTGLVDIGEFIG